MAIWTDALADFPRLGLFSQALEGISQAQIEEWLTAAESLARGYLAERYCLPLVWSFLPSASRSGPGTGPIIDTFGAGRLNLVLDFTAGAGTLVVTVNHSDDGITFTSAGVFPTLIGAPRHQPLALGDSNLTIKRYVRMSWTTSAAATFGVSWDGDDLKSAVCKIAAYEGLTARGLDPQGRDEILSQRRDQALSWLKDVRAGRTSPEWIDQTPETEEQRAYVASRPRRRWTG